jgi:hypothetical protein
MGWLIDRCRQWQRRRAEQRFRKCLESRTAPGFLGAMLGLMRLAFKLDEDFRRNITGFEAVIQFRSPDNTIARAAIFNGRDMELKNGIVPGADIEVIFKDGRALLNYLLGPDRDILKMLLNNEVVLKGNVNYMMKFGYMANHLQLALSERR